eukprot:1481433-Prorocentrum_lima.AAC.1
MLNRPEWEQQPPDRLPHLCSQVTRTPGSILSIRAPGIRRPRMPHTGLHSNCYAVCKSSGYASLDHHESLNHIKKM